MPLGLFRKKSKTFALSHLSALSFFLLIPSSAHAAANPVVSGNARFTVVTPLCIRLEYSPDKEFVDAPSLFAAGRSARFNNFRLTHSGKSTTIDTGAIRLTYTPDSLPFSTANLHADIHTGSVVAQWTPGASNPGNLGGTIRTLDQAIGPMDLGQGLISRDGWYLLDDSKSQLLTNGWVQSRPAGSGTDWYLFGYGHDYRAALKSLAVIGGPAPLPRKYALGTWFSRFWAFSSDDYRKIVAEYGQHDFPLDNIVLDMDWHKDGWTGWSWNRNLLPDAEALLPWFHSQGLHTTLNLHPADGVGPQEDQYAAFMKDMGEDPASGRTIPFDAASKKYMGTLFKDVLDPLAREGVDFWWLDWQQYEFTRSVPDLTNLFWLNTLLYQNTEQDGRRGLSFSRWAGWGDHRHPIHFSGDANTGFPMLAFEVPFTSTAGNVGCFFWSHDIGGHWGGRNEESYTRWVQFGATSPVLRSHSVKDPTTDRRPWNYPKWAEDSMRIAFHMRDEMFPYIYSSAWETCRDMVPLNRPLYIDYPGTEQAYHNAQEYLYGDGLLVAPIVTPGVGPGHVSHQTVWFPKGSDWYNYFTGERYAGGSDALVSADINEFPLFVKGGMPIPMQNYTPRMATAPLNTLRVRCYPGADGYKGVFTLYEDDGQTSAHKDGAFSTTLMSYVRHGNTVTISIGPAKGHYAGQVTQRDIVIELPDTVKGSKAMIDGKPAAVIYDAAKMVNTIRIPARSVFNAATVVVQAVPADTRKLASAAALRRIGGILGSFDFNGSATTRNLLTTALAKTTDPALHAELMAVAGIGLVSHSMAPYMYGGESRDLFFSTPGIIDGERVTAMPLGAETSTHSVPFDATGPKITRNGRQVTMPGEVSFMIGGQKLRLTAGPAWARDLLGSDNVAAGAKITVSGSEYGYSPEGATDGIAEGYPQDKDREWSAGAGVGATLRLEWNTAQTIDRIVLCDRPNTTDQITAGTLTFSDGSTLDVGALPDDGTALDLRFAPKSITSVIFTVTGVKQGTENAGLAEIGVFRAG